MAPEYAMEGFFSVKSDVFSFGVILLEILCGKKISGFYVSEHGQSLLSCAWNLWCEGKCLELMDPILEDSYAENEVLKCIHIALLCVQEDAADRPTMSTIVVMLASDTMSFPMPSRPAFSVGRKVTEDLSTSKDSKDASINEVTLSSIKPR
ncbi:hypothetical protein QN277_009339 [Acacia crassicarpa]|uniref:Uncharacterized protein n=1 Tax=Acacia crassicarpa TaxID=499986 RepID=A0AAE1ITL2_9FABA|nr:hypothetical protein QN277_009339 [Acacia crassicarpa]